MTDQPAINPPVSGASAPALPPVIAANPAEKPPLKDELSFRVDELRRELGYEPTWKWDVKRRDGSDEVAVGEFMGLEFSEADFAREYPPGQYTRRLFAAGRKGIVATLRWRVAGDVAPSAPAIAAGGDLPAWARMMLEESSRRAERAEQRQHELTLALMSKRDDGLTLKDLVPLIVNKPSPVTETIAALQAMQQLSASMAPKGGGGSDQDFWGQILGEGVRAAIPLLLTRPDASRQTGAASAAPGVPGPRTSATPALPASPAPAPSAGSVAAQPSPPAGAPAAPPPGAAVSAAGWLIPDAALQQLAFAFPLASTSEDTAARVCDGIAEALLEAGQRDKFLAAAPVAWVDEVCTRLGYPPNARALVETVEREVRARLTDPKFLADPETGDDDGDDDEEDAAAA